LDAAGIEADELTVHTPDLDDVFFALTADTTLPHQTAQATQATQPKETVR
ncbi:ABC transporter, partial [Streptomyces sp. NPDC002324]